MTKELLFTKEELEKLKQEYQRLCLEREKKLKNTPSEIFHSEDLNPEYLSFFEEIEILDKRILELKKIIEKAKLIQPSLKKDETAQLGSTVVLEDKKGKLVCITLVGNLEANPAEGKISINSPLGKALFGRKKGEKISLPSKPKNSFVIKKIEHKLD
jgi:transcription elongation factor GreA